MCSGSHVSASFATSSWYQWSLPSVIGTSLPVRRTTTTFLTVGEFSQASSTLRLSGTTLPRRHPSSAVMIATAAASFMRSRTASALNPPKTTEWAAPILAHASIAIGSSGIIGM